MTQETPPRSTARDFFAKIVTGLVVALALGAMTRMATLLEANDISRWCTVWSLLERGTYAIDDCPWQSRTQDKVQKPDRLTEPEPDAPLLKKLEYRLAPNSWKAGEPTDRFYSSKPALLPTLIAGVLYPARVLSGVPLDRVVEQQREPRYVPKPVDGEPGKFTFTMETPKEPAHWPVYIYYFKPIIVLLNIVPLLMFLSLYGRLLDRVATNDWAWFLSFVSAGIGTYLFPFNLTLNNHTVAAFSAFFAIWAFLRIWNDESRSALTFAACGFFGAFCACNEIPAGCLGLILFLTLLARSPKSTLIYFVPAAALPVGAFLLTQFLAFGQFRPVYEEFGTKTYEYAGSYWTTPLELDYLNKEPESKLVYLFHMTFGHHGVFSLTPIFLFSIYGAFREISKRGRLSSVAVITTVLTIAMFAFYTWNPKARNYGGSTQGLRWLFWLIPLWLMLLPSGLAGAGESRWGRRLSLLAFAISVFSVGYALRSPWTHPWLLDGMEHFDLYPLKR